MPAKVHSGWVLSVVAWRPYLQVYCGAPGLHDGGLEALRWHKNLGDISWGLGLSCDHYMSVVRGFFLVLHTPH
eukprot:316347-Amphidinium_carterae.1